MSMESLFFLIDNVHGVLSALFFFEWNGFTFGNLKYRLGAREESLNYM